MTYQILKSGSSGNAVVVNDVILIDCGVDFKTLSAVYKGLKTVLLTHIHSDHFKKRTIKKLAFERPTLRFACCEWLVADLISCGVSKKNIDVLEIGKIYDYKLFKVSPIKLYHNVPNCGYRLYMNGEKALYATDTGTLDGIEAKGYDLYLIEANHTEEEIQERIRRKEESGEFVYEYEAMKNHLSKEKCDEFILNNIIDGEYVYLHQHKDRGVKYEA
jgi:ribonuclease BN (tRNA processing enzyme)